MNFHPFFTCILLPIFFFGCAHPSSQPALKKHTQIGEFFGSVVQVDVCYGEREEDRVRQALAGVWDRFEDIHGRMSVYDPKSDMNKVNGSYPEPVAVGADTYGLIRDAVGYHGLSQGVFDITVYPLIAVWKESGKKNVLPTAEELAGARKAVGVKNVELLPGNRIRLLSPATKLSIDSIGDGYAADEAARILRSHGFTHFLVDASGELVAGGRNCEGRRWRIGVRDPQDKTKLIDVLDLENAATSTSGSYERYYEINGVRWPHIINPVTGYPGRGVLSATVVAPTGQFADFWSTALCLLDPEQGIAMTDAMGEGFAAMVIVDRGEGKIIKKASRNYARYSSRR